MRLLVDMRQSVGAAAGRVRRVTFGAFGLRVAALLTGLAALLVAVPADVRTTPVPLGAMVVLALVVAIAPGSWFAALLELAAIGAWLAGTFGSGEPVTWPRLTSLALLLYVHHVLCVWSQAVPLDTVLVPQVWRAGALRLAAVGGATAVLSAGALQLAGQLDFGAGASELAFSVAIPVLGVLGVILVAAGLTYLLRRR